MTTYRNYGGTRVDRAYAAGLRDAEHYLATAEERYTGPKGELTEDEAFAWYDGYVYVINEANRTGSETVAESIARMREGSE